MLSDRNIADIILAESVAEMCSRRQEIEHIDSIVNYHNNKKDAQELRERLYSYGFQYFTSGIFYLLLKSGVPNKFFNFFDSLTKYIPGDKLKSEINYDVIKIILKSTDLELLSKQLRLLYYISPNIFKLANILKILQENDSNLILATLLYEYLNLTSVDNYREAILEIKEDIFLLNNVYELSLSMCTNEISPKLLAIDILLKLRQQNSRLNSKLTEKGLAQRTAIRDMVGQRATNAQTAMVHASHVIEKFKPVFISEPYNNKLLAVEIFIKTSILIEIYNTSDSDEVKRFIEDNKVKLAEGSDKELNKQARTYFTSNINQAEVAWRCYDSDAEVTGSHPNLFTQPKEEAKDSLINIGMQKFNTASYTSLRVRYASAIFYLAAIDSSTVELQKNKAYRVKQYIYTLAEIRRACNVSSEQDQTDQPSCYPDIFTRFSSFVQCHPNCQYIKPDPESIIKAVVKAYIESKLDEIYNNKSISKTEKLKYYYACIIIGVNNLKEILDGSEDFGILDTLEPKLDIKEALQYRAKLIKEINIFDIVDKVKDRFTKENIVYNASLIYCKVKENIYDLNNLHIQLSEARLREFGLSAPLPVKESQPISSFIKKVIRVGVVASVDEQSDGEPVSIQVGRSVKCLG